MSRYTGSTFKKSRRLGFSVLETNKEFNKGKKRKTAPGQHGAGRRKMSNYALQMAEKQKLQHVYGLTDRQLRNTFSKARYMEGVLGTNLLIRLESRLDNLVYRMGFAPTRRGARQLVGHRHVTVNGKIVNIPSYVVAVSDVVAIKQKSQGLPLVAANMDVVSSFVDVQKDLKTGKYARFPERSELNPDINETFVVEWFNRVVK